MAKDDDFRLEITQPTKGSVDAQFRKKVNEIFNKHALDAADELQRLSPVGATGDLKRGWDVIPARRSPIGFEVTVPIVNNAPNALNRIVGRGPGKFPPEAPIAAWVDAKGIDKKAIFPIRRAIATKGTKRWRDGKNFAGLDRDGKPLPGSPIKRAEAKIAAELQNLELE